MVSPKKLLPPSMMMSPFSRWGSNCSIMSSTALPALIMSITLRGRARLSQNSSTL